MSTTLVPVETLTDVHRYPEIASGVFKGSKPSFDPEFSTDGVAGELVSGLSFPTTPSDSLDRKTFGAPSMASSDHNRELRRARSLARYYFEQLRKCQAEQRQSALQADKARANEKALSLKVAELERKLRTNETVIGLLQRGFDFQKRISDELALRVNRNTPKAQDPSESTETEKEVVEQAPSDRPISLCQSIDGDPFHYDTIESKSRTMNMADILSQFPTPTSTLSGHALRGSTTLSTQKELRRVVSQANNEALAVATPLMSKVDSVQVVVGPTLYEPKFAAVVEQLKKESPLAAIVNLVASEYSTASSSSSENGLSISFKEAPSATPKYINNDTPKHHTVTIVPRADYRARQRSKEAEIPCMIVTSPTLASLAADICLDGPVDPSPSHVQGSLDTPEVPTCENPHCDEIEQAEPNNGDQGNNGSLTKDLAPLNDNSSHTSDIAAHVGAKAGAASGLERVFEEFFKHRNLGSSGQHTSLSSSTIDGVASPTILTPTSPFSVNTGTSLTTLTTRDSRDSTGNDYPARSPRSPYALEGCFTPETPNYDTSAVIQPMSSKRWAMSKLLKKVKRAYKSGIKMR